MVASATTIIFYPMWSRMSARRGNFLAIVVSTAGLSLYPLVTAFIPSIEWVSFAAFLGGVFSSGFALSLFNGLLEVCPDQTRASHIAVYSTLVNVAAFVAPVLSTWLTMIFGIHSMLLLGALLRALGALLFWLQRNALTVAAH
jgi:MFS family permease